MDEELAYLQPGFSSSSLTVAKLRGILLKHDVAFKSNAKKAELVKLFQDHVASAAPALLARSHATEPSDAGIETLAMQSARQADSSSPLPSPAQPAARISTSTKPRNASSKASARPDDDEIFASKSTSASVSRSPSKGKSTSPRKSAATPAARKSVASAIPGRSRVTTPFRAEDNEAELERQLGLGGFLSGTAKKQMERSGLHSPGQSSPPRFESPAESRPKVVGRGNALRELSPDSDSDEPSSSAKPSERSSRISRASLPASASTSNLNGENGHTTEPPSSSPVSSKKRSRKSGFSNHNPFQRETDDDTDEDAEERTVSSKKKARQRSPRHSEDAESNLLATYTRGLSETEAMEDVTFNTASETPSFDMSPPSFSTIGSNTDMSMQSAGVSAATTPLPRSQSAQAALGSRNPTLLGTTGKDRRSTFTPHAPSPLTLHSQTRGPSVSFGKAQPDLSSNGSSSSPARVSSRSPKRASMPASTTQAQTQGTPSFIQYMAPIDQLVSPPPEEYARFLNSVKGDTSANGSNSVSAAPAIAATPEQTLAKARADSKALQAEESRRKRIPRPPKPRELILPKPHIVLPDLFRPIKQFVLSPLSYLFLFATLLTYGNWYRSQKLAKGLCDTGSDSVGGRHAPFSIDAGTDHIDADGTQIRVLRPRATAIQRALVPVCTLCPLHGICQDGHLISCQKGYVARKSSFTLGGFLPIAPVCQPDTARSERIESAAKLATRLLQRHRGEIICNTRMHLASPSPPLGEERFGTEADTLKSDLLRVETKWSPQAWQDAVEEAIAQLHHRDGILSQPANDRRMLIARDEIMTLTCRARLASQRFIFRHKGSIAIVLALLGFSIWAKFKYNQRVKTRAAVGEMVETALDKLQDQQYRYYLDPSLTPTPYVAPAHLRDAILFSVHSPASRQAQWRQVEKIVEGNANVRVREAEQRGEMLRVWEWVGEMEFDYDFADTSMASMGGSPAGSERRRRRISMRPNTPAVAASTSALYPSLP